MKDLFDISVNLQHAYAVSSCRWEHWTDTIEEELCLILNLSVVAASC